jgi:hypothetical protein
MANKLNHLPKNPFCGACVRGKMKEKSGRRGAFQRKTEKSGDIIMFDHLYSGSARAIGLEGETEAFVVCDLHTGIVHAYPVPDKEARHVVHSLQMFTGTRKISLVYSDNAPELLKSSALMSVPHETSQPGVAHTNSKIERCNQLILGGTISSLMEAGLPPCYWSYAAPCFCINYNNSMWNGKSPWRSLWGHMFQGNAFPFGCLVHFKDMVQRRSSST